jgi:hypothetical protein
VVESAADIYALPVEDPGVDTRARLFRECEAMISYMGSRGIAASQTILDKAGLLDVGIVRRGEIAMSELLLLHGALAEAVRPALPRTIELLQWNSGNQGWLSLLAPVQSIRVLILATLGFFILFLVTIMMPQVNADTISSGIFARSFVADPPNAASARAFQAADASRAAAEAAGLVQRETARAVERQADLAAAERRLAGTSRTDETAMAAARQGLERAQQEYAAAQADADEAATIAEVEARKALEAARAAAGRGVFDRGRIFWVTAFYISLAGLGACFSVLYDARKFVVEGTYDPRVGSNYTIRVALGVVSGVLLAQILTDPEIGDNASGLQVFGLPVLALLGGFGAQLVYTILMKLVAAAESIFEEDRREAILAREQAVVAANQVAAGQERADRTAAVAETAVQVENARTPEARRLLLDRMVKLAAGVKPADDVTEPPGRRLPLLASIATRIGLARRLLDLLPREDKAAATGKLDTTAEKLAKLHALVETGGTGNAAGAAALLFDELSQADPVRRLLDNALGSFAAPLSGGPLAALNITPAGLAITVATLALDQGTKSYARWKTRVLDADYTPNLLSPSDLDSTAVANALASVGGGFQAAFAGIAGNVAALADLGRQVATLNDDDLFARHGAAFPDRASFDAGFIAFRRALLDPAIAREVPKAALDEAGVGNVADLLAAIDAVRADPAGRAELERLFLAAAALRGAGAEADRAALLALLRETKP